MGTRVVARQRSGREEVAVAEGYRAPAAASSRAQACQVRAATAVAEGSQPTRACSGRHRRHAETHKRHRNHIFNFLYTYILRRSPAVGPQPQRRLRTMQMGHVMDSLPARAKSSACRRLVAQWPRSGAPECGASMAGHAAASTQPDALWPPAPTDKEWWCDILQASRLIMKVQMTHKVTKEMFRVACVYIPHKGRGNYQEQDSQKYLNGAQDQNIILDDFK